MSAPSNPTVAQSSWALLSVSDKTGLIPFARKLLGHGFRLLSTGGTARELREHGLPVTEASDLTASPEILDGRVKTLHPKIHGGILYNRANPHHAADIVRLGIEPIDLVVVNLYPFEEKVPHAGLPLAEAIEWIDVGGPSMLRAAAKNHQHVTTVVDPQDYPLVLESFQQPKDTAAVTRLRLAAKVFRLLARYDSTIADYLDSQVAPDESTSSELFTATFDSLFPDRPRRLTTLRYGENPQQKAALYGDPHWGGMSAVECLQGKELSYNNLLDLDASCQLVREWEEPAVAIIKHTNPCGFALNEKAFVANSTEISLEKLVARARSCDPKSAFGGILAANRPIDGKTAVAITEQFMECVLAPEYTEEALAVFSKKPSLRVIRLSSWQSRCTIQVRSLFGGLLVQTEDNLPPSPQSWRLATDAPVDPSLKRDLLLAERVAKHVKSNAIVLARDGQTIGIGAGQMSRIDAAVLAVRKAQEAGFSTQGAVLASDAFFPFADTVEFAAAHGITAVVQPGGSVRDQESIDAAKKHSIAMILTGVRHFRH